MRFLKHYGLTG